MILYWLILLTTLAGVGTGLYCLFRGVWDRLAVKYAAVALSTTASFFLFILYLTHPNMLKSRDDFYFDYAIGALTRNAAIILFHLTCGRDARCFNPHMDRRLKA